ncbi:MAG: ABC transporter ATP-binding protein [Phycisphaerales bacterium]|nr:ABC transporter ATP-binding protein [Phycisphaerales bacterium]MCB9854379.1 ABC transporter ATP-binding protein [Phycisphaerales bacterium]MCB9863580.1 ABC transporter ATP-binding protein [Phycisphaerales bacterium]
MTVTSTLEEPAAARPLIRVDGLVKDFTEKNRRSTRALRNISISVAPGEILGLVGPDGAGKTTLIRCIAGLLEPTTGTISVLDLDTLRDTIAIRGRIGYMPQKFGLYQDLTVQENLDLYADLQSVPISERRDRYARLMKMTNLERFTRRLAGRLSGGMKQKLGLACALIKSPELLLLDEPTVGVDPVSRRELWQIIDELVEDDRIGVLVSTAYLDEAERCDRVAVMFDGEIVDTDSPGLFRSRLNGSVFQVACESQRSARRIHGRAVESDQVADATVRSGRIRIVRTQESDAMSIEQLGASLGVELAPSEPLFEDAFMQMAHSRRSRDEEHHAIPAPKDAAKLATFDHNEVVVRVRNLVKRFGDFEAVKHVSFDVHAGEVFGLLGPNGAGKSTTFRMLCGLLKATEGEVRVAGHDLRHAAGRARSRLGYMAQQFSLYSQLSVHENLRFFGRAYGLDRRRLRDRIDWAYEQYGLAPRRDAAAGALPGGYKQRLAMAVATLHEPEILFLDEPTSGVDPLARREFWRRINAFAETGVTVIVTTHFMEEAEYCDRMMIMTQGAPLAMGSPGEIRELARDDEHVDPSIEDAFIALAENRVRPGRLSSSAPEGVE